MSQQNAFSGQKPSRSLNVNRRSTAGHSAMSMPTMAAPEGLEGSPAQAGNIFESSVLGNGKPRAFGMLPSSGGIPKYDSAGGPGFSLSKFVSQSGPWVPSQLIDPNLENGYATVSDQGLPNNTVGRMFSYDGYRSSKPLTSECESQFPPPPSDSGYGTRQGEELSIYGDQDRSMETQSVTGHMERLMPVETARRESEVAHGNWQAPPPPSVSSEPAAAKLICSDCNNQVKNKSELNKHKQRHTKPHRCAVAGCPRGEEGFTSNNDLARHMITVHKQVSNNQGLHKWYVCNLGACQNGQKVWPRADNFRQHLKKVHDYHLIGENALDCFKHQRDSTDFQAIGAGIPAGLPSCFEDDRTRNTTMLSSPWPAELNQPSLELSSARRLRQQDGHGYHVEYNDDFRHHFPDLPGPLGQPNNLPGGLPMFTVGTLELESLAVDDSRSAPQESQCIAPDAVLQHTFTNPRGIPQGANLSRNQDRTTEEPPSGRSDKRQSQSSIAGDDASLTGPSEESNSGGEDQISERVDSSRSSSPEPSDAPGSPEPVIVANANEKLASSSETEAKVPPDVKRPLVIGDEKQMLALLKQLIEEGKLDNLLKKVAGPPETKKPEAASRSGTSGGFPCPYENCDKIFGRNCELKKHRKRHERPYGCTFPNCLKTFGSKNDWKRHENSQHFQLEVWRCDVAAPGRPNGICGKACHRRETFRTHLSKDHQVTDEQELDSRASSCRIGRNCETRFWCGFCEEIIDVSAQCDGVNGAWKARFNHIDDHFHGRHQRKKQPIADWKNFDPDMPELETHPSSSSPDDSPSGSPDPEEQAADEPPKQNPPTEETAKAPHGKRKADSEPEQIPKRKALKMSR